MTTYLAQAFDTRHNWLDTDDRGEGYSTEIDGAGAMLDFIATKRSGVLHDWDGEIHATKRIAYWVISVGGVAREVYVTPWGQHCRTQVPDRGPGCHRPVPAPSR